MNAYGQHERIQKWVTTIASGNSEEERVPWTAPPHPPSSSSKPKKRRRVGDDDYISSTINQSHNCPPPLRPAPVILQPPTSRHEPPMRWSKDLKRLEKPVHFEPLEDCAAGLPQDICHLYRRVRDLSVERKWIMNHTIRQEITELLGWVPMEEWFTPAFSSPSCFSSPWESTRHEQAVKKIRDRAMMKLLTLNHIKSIAHQTLLRDDAQEEWFHAVFKPLAENVMPSPSVEPTELGAARISPAFYPWSREGKKLPNDTRIEGALTYQAWDISPDAKQREADDVICYRLDRESEDQRHINATKKSTNSPICVHIATSFSEAPDEGRARLGIWVAAWHLRMGALLQRRQQRLGAEKLVMITLPLIHVVEHEWKLLFACDRGDHIRILGDISIGDTKSILGLHILAAVLSELNKWGYSVFADWIIKNLASKWDD